MQHKPKTKNELRDRRHKRVRAKIVGTGERPRLAVHKSNRFVSAQLIDDTKQITIASAHGRDFKKGSSAGGGSLPDGKAGASGGQSVQAKAVGEAIARAAKALGLSAVVFDRGGYRYGGQVKTLAEAARAGGLIF